jgi:hypothetical protein
MPGYFNRLLEDLMSALEGNSAALESNSNDIGSLLHRIEAGDIAPSDAEALRRALAAASDRLRQERLALVSVASDLRLRAPNADQTRSRHACTGPRSD